MTRPAPFCFAESTPRRPTAPSPTTATVMPGLTWPRLQRTSRCPPRRRVPRGSGSGRAKEAPGWPPGCRPQAGRAAAAPAPRPQTPCAGRTSGIRRGSADTCYRRRRTTDDELAWFDRGDCATDLLDDAAVLVPHRGRLGNGLNAAIGPQVRPAYARSRYPDHGIRRFHDRRGGALLETHIARTVENSSSHGLAPCLSRHARNKAAANGLALLARSGPSFLRNRADNHERHGAVMILSLSVRCSRRPRRARDRLRSLRRGCKARERQRQFPRLGQVARSTDLLRCLSWPLAPWPTCPQPSAYRWSWAHCVDADTPGGIFERSTLRQPDHSVLGCMVPPDGVRSMPGADAWARCAASGPCAQARGDHADPSPSQNMMSKMQ